MSQIDCILSLLHEALAAELREMRVRVEEIADVLVADEELAMKYVEQLQAFDLVIQRAEESARLLDRIAMGERTADVIEGVRLNLFQERLRAAVALAA